MADYADHSISRRRFLRVAGGFSGSLVVGGLLVACGSTPAAQPTASQPTAAAAAAAPTAAPTATTAAAAAAPAATPTAAAAATVQPAAQAAASTKAPVVLEAWAHWDQGIQWIIDAMQHNNFPNSNISIKKVVYPFDEVHNKMLAACVSGVGQPDIMRVEQGRMGAFLRGGACFVDLKPLIGNQLSDLVLGSAVDYWSFKERIYGIGNEMNACALAVRKSMWDAAGVKTPDGDWVDIAPTGKTPFDTWADFQKAAAQLKASKGQEAIAWHDQSDGDFQMLLFAGGGLMFDQNGDFGGATDLGASILTMMHDMLHKDKTAIAAPVTGDQTWSSPVYWATFKSDKVISSIGAPWHIGNLGQTTAIGPTQSGQWRLQRLPSGFGTNLKTATHGGTSVSIPAGSKHHDEAWSVIQFTHLTKAVLEDFNQRGIMVTYKPALQDPQVLKPWDYYGGESIGTMYVNIAQDMPRIFQSPWAPQIHTSFQNNVLTPILRDPNAGPSDIQKAFTKLKADIDRIKTL